MNRHPSATAHVLFLSAALAACDASGGDGRAARVGDWVLSTDRLAELLVLAQPLPLDSATVSDLVEEWVSRAALASYELQGGDLMGAEATAASLWMEEREALLDAARSQDAPGASAPGPPEARAVFDADSLRLFAHVLRSVNASTSLQERDLQRRTAQEILSDLRAGGSWSSAVARSEDEATRPTSGLLGLMRPDELPPALRPLGTRLQPGQVSAVVESPAGFHILYRPRFEDVAQLFAELLAERRAEAAEARADAEVLAALEMDTAPGALERTRAGAASPLPRRTRDGVALTWQDGTLPEDVLARYVAALDPGARSALAQAGDDEVSRFLRQVAVREVRVRWARDGGVRPDPAAMEALATLHREEVRQWRQAVPTNGGDAAARAALARHMERLVARQSQVPPVPPVLEWWLLSRTEWSVDPEGVREAIRRARELVGAAAGGALEEGGASRGGSP